MKKHTEKLPIDDLFARKLGKMSMPPSTDGFERLQVRMGQQKPEARVVFWQNASVQRYAAVAACLLMVCLLGWLYWPSGRIVEYASKQVAKNQSVGLPVHKPYQQQNKAMPDAGTPTELSGEPNNEQVAIATKSVQKTKRDNGLVKQSAGRSKIGVPIQSATTEVVLAQVQPSESKLKTNIVVPTIVEPANQSATQRVADNKIASKPDPVAERVLVVTIEEPQALVAARQVAKPATEELVVSTNDKPEKDIKGNGLWQQVKRIKQGDVFARQDNDSNDDRGLLSRAYNGIKHSFEKDKSAKQ